MEPATNPVRRDHPNPTLGVVLGLLAVVQVLGLFTPVLEQEGYSASYWNVLGIAGFRVSVILMIVALLVLAMAVAVGRWREPATAALLLCSAAPVWGAVYLDEGEGVRGLLLVHLVDNDATGQLTAVGWLWSLSFLVIIGVVLGLTVGPIRRLFESLRGDAAGLIEQQDVLVGVVGVVVVVIGWFQHGAKVGPVDESVVGLAPRLGAWSVRTGVWPDRASVVDSVLWIACPVAVALGLVGLGPLRGWLERRWIWIGCAAGSATVFVSTMFMTWKGTDPAGFGVVESEIEPNLTLLMVSLAAVVVFLVAAWLARPTDVAHGGTIEQVDGPEPDVSP